MFGRLATKMLPTSGSQSNWSPQETKLTGGPLSYHWIQDTFQPPTALFTSRLLLLKNRFPEPNGSSYTPATVSTCVWSLAPTDHSAPGFWGSSPRELNVENPLSVLVMYFESVYDSRKVNPLPVRFWKLT